MRNETPRNNNPNVTCFNCNQRGHISSQYPNFNRNESRNERPNRENQSANFAQNSWNKTVQQPAQPIDDLEYEYLVNQQGPLPKAKPIAPITKAIQPYSIIQDLKDQKANITFGQLLQIAPSIRIELVNGLRRKREEEISAYNNISTRTTALCCSANVTSIPITLIIDSGASGSVVSKTFLDKHGLTIE
jgi:hypothetical protein